MTPKPNDSAAVFDAVALERDLAKLNLERPITEYRQFFEFMPAGQMRRCELMALHETSMHPIYIGETPEVIAMCNRLNQYLRMIRTLSGGPYEPIIHL